MLFFKKKIKNNIILAIDTSFDDTTCAILKGNKILSNIIYTQKIHNVFKGVKPKIAYDLHIMCIYKVVKKAIEKSKINIKNINAISYTKGPGLIGCLMIGENFAKSLSLGLNKPLIYVNHIHGHIFSNFLYKKNNKYPKFPYICLSISGGHTKLFIIKKFNKIKEKGETLDDSLGNLFNKFSILLGFKYYKGPEKIVKMSKKGKNIYSIPIPRVDKYNFSFSGLITNLKKKIKKIKLNKIKIRNLCKSFLSTIFIILIKKIKKLYNDTKIKNLVITGGVSCNSYFYKRFKNISKKYKFNLFINKNKNLNKDNAAMIGIVGQIKYYLSKFDNFKNNKKIKINKL